MATVLPKTCKDRGTIILRSEAHNYGYTFSKVLLEVRSFLVPRSIVKPGAGELISFVSFQAGIRLALPVLKSSLFPSRLRLA
jgi:hypothetical protein